MADVVADLHLHSKYSRAVSPQMTPPVMASYAKKKGIDLLATSDWTHPLWLREIHNFLTDAEEGLFKIKNPTEDNKDTRFLLSVEVSSIYSQGGKVRRIHNLIWSPSFATAEKINKALLQRGCNLSSDGRPIIGLSAKSLLELVLEIDERALLIPCHVWTPWFSLYGSNSGFDSIEECFGEYADKIYGIETGLSSDPEMNWQIPELDTRSILSFSDAHSPAKMGREATVFRLQDLSFENIRHAVMAPSKKEKGDNHVLYTIEFYPEEGKYHFDGHRNCKISQSPDITKKNGEICPVCKKKLTIGVMHRVWDLAKEEPRGEKKENEKGLVWIRDPKGKHPPFVKLVPLNEIIAEAIGSPVSSPKVAVIFDELCRVFGSELEVLLKISPEDIQKIAGEKVAEGVAKVRNGNIVIHPGFDGEYGIVKIWEDKKEEQKKPVKNQIGIDF